MQSGVVLGGQAETTKSKQTHPVASISVKSEGMQESECILVHEFSVPKLKRAKIFPKSANGLK